jgi:predicted dehydrogenase
MRERTVYSPSAEGLSRRRFIGRALGSAAAWAAAPLILRSGLLAGPGAPSNRLTVACIGCGMISGKIRNFLGDPRVSVIAACDVDKKRREKKAAEADGHYSAARASGAYKGCATYGDFRELLQREDLDAVFIGVPDHWHAPIALAAVRAGKAIYLEKPLALTIPEGRAIVDAVERHGVAFQLGCQQRADPNFRDLAQAARNGRFGKLTEVQAAVSQGGNKKSKNQTGAAAPEGLDFDFWLGPAPEAPFSADRIDPWGWRWIMDYSGGQITDWITHHPDIGVWGAGKAREWPTEVIVHAVTWNDDPLFNSAYSWNLEFVYADGFRLKYATENFFRGGVKFVGSDGWGWVNRAVSIETSDPRLMQKRVRPDEDVLVRRPEEHIREFVTSALEGRSTCSPVLEGHHTAALAHMGNIAMRLGRSKLRFDGKTETFVDDPAANALLHRTYRRPWTL